MIDETARASQVTGQRATNFDVELAARFLREHRIKRDDFPDIDRLQTEFVRDPLNLFFAETFKMFLQQMTKPQDRRAFLIRRIMRDDLVDVLLEFDWDD